MNEIIIKMLVAADKFMPEMHLKQPGFTYGGCGPFTKNKERIQKSKETGDTRCIYRNELDKACFQHDFGYGDFRHFARRTASDKVLKDKAFDIAENKKYDAYQRRLALWFINFLIKIPLHLQANLLKVVVLIIKLDKMSNSLKNSTNQWSKSFKKEEQG